MAIRPRTNQAWLLRSDRARAKARSLRIDRARAKARSLRSLRSDRERMGLGRYVATELEPNWERSDSNSLPTEACGRGIRFYHPFTRANRPSIDIDVLSSIDRRLEFGKRDSTGRRMISMKSTETIMDMPEMYMNTSSVYPRMISEVFWKETQWMSIAT
ncbi:hypothetical protein F2Q69_00030189 [Brassica cretica]|uniref:Uncharacterized protein n=1 Tax=Brassica cretica TaxID=69181 RepID=A0A8S9S7L7_BRACR|nr:hypothetical protein F2Q69_00030189 [Brassica cretica]